jgi:hypothetical protein
MTDVEGNFFRESKFGTRVCFSLKELRGGFAGGGTLLYFEKEDFLRFLLPRIRLGVMETAKWLHYYPHLSIFKNLVTCPSRT